MSKIKRTFIIFLSLVPSALFGQLKGFTSIHNPVNEQLVNFLERSNYGKFTYNYDNISKKDGNWELFPTSQVNDSLIVVLVSSVPERPTEYSFLIFVNLNTMVVEEQLGPYYDSYIDGIKVQVKKENIDRVIVRLIDSCDEYEPITFVTYKRKGSYLKQIKTLFRN